MDGSFCSALKDQGFDANVNSLKYFELSVLATQAVDRSGQ